MKMRAAMALGKTSVKTLHANETARRLNTDSQTKKRRPTQTGLAHSARPAANPAKCSADMPKTHGMMLRRGTREASHPNRGRATSVAAKVALKSHWRLLTPPATPIVSRTGRSRKYAANSRPIRMPALMMALLFSSSLFPVALSPSGRELIHLFNLTNFRPRTRSAHRSRDDHDFGRQWSAARCTGLPPRSSNIASLQALDRPIHLVIAGVRQSNKKRAGCPPVSSSPQGGPSSSRP